MLNWKYILMENLLRQWYGRLTMADKQTYQCPRGHKFETDAPIIIAVDSDPEYNSGVVCPYCYVNWFRLNVSAEISANEVDDSY